MVLSCNQRHHLTIRDILNIVKLLSLHFLQWYCRSVLTFVVLLLFQELCLCHREKERLAEELFGKTDEKQNLDVLLNQLEQEKQRLAEKVENLEITSKCLNIDSFLKYIFKDAFKILTYSLVITLNKVSVLVGTKKKKAFQY